jgi:integron integrase
MSQLLDDVTRAIAARHFSPKTGEAYRRWIRRFVVYHGKRHPRDLGGPEVGRFLNYLATDRRVAASTQNQALSAILFLYREVLEIELPWLDDIVRAKQPVRVPTVLSVREVERVMDRLQGQTRLVASLLYGAGLRLMEALRLRAQDLDFARREIVVRRGKGRKDRRTMLPYKMVASLEDHLAVARRQHAADLKIGAGYVEIPGALAKKYPNAGREWPWQWVFPATRRYRHPGHDPHPATFVRDPSAGGGVRHPDHSGAAGTHRSGDDHDLHARAQQGRAGSQESAGQSVRLGGR